MLHRRAIAGAGARCQECVRRKTAFCGEAGGVLRAFSVENGLVSLLDGKVANIQKAFFHTDRAAKRDGPAVKKRVCAERGGGKALGIANVKHGNARVCGKGAKPVANGFSALQLAHAKHP